MEVYPESNPLLIFFVSCNITHKSRSWTYTLCIRCIKTFQRRHKEGILRARRGLPLLTPSLPSLCPLYALSIHWTDTDWIPKTYLWESAATSCHFPSISEIQYRFHLLIQRQERIGLGSKKKNGSFKLKPGIIPDTCFLNSGIIFIANFIIRSLKLNNANLLIFSSQP